METGKYVSIILSHAGLYLLHSGSTVPIREVPPILGVRPSGPAVEDR